MHFESILVDSSKCSVFLKRMFIKPRVRVRVKGKIWIKFRRLVQNDMSTAVMWSKSKPDVEFQYGGRFG